MWPLVSAAIAKVKIIIADDCTVEAYNVFPSADYAQGQNEVGKSTMHLWLTSGNLVTRVTKMTSFKSHDC